jgi:hypothetical protein
MSDILNALSTLKDNGLTDSTIKSVIDELLENDSLDDGDDTKLLVVAYDRLDNGGFTADIEQSKYDDCTFTVDGEDWLVCDDDEKETKWEEALDSYLDEGCVEGADSPYFDRERWKRDARMDGDGHCLSGYDGNVNEHSFNNEWYYLYRQN